MVERPAPVLVYDGDCSFCTASALRISGHWRSSARAVLWQQLDAAELHALGITSEDVREAAWWVDASGRRSRGHLAIAHALAAADGWRSICGHALLLPPLRWVARGLYPLAARWRHRLPEETARVGASPWLSTRRGSLGRRTPMDQNGGAIDLWRRAHGKDE